MLKLTKQLQALSKDRLIDIIIQISQHSTGNKKFITTLLASNDPNKLSKLLIKEVKQLEQSAPTYDYRETNLVSGIILDILNQVEANLIEDAPNLAIQILKALIKIDGKLFGHLDDSYGELGDAYYLLYSLLDKAFANANESPEVIAKYLIEVYLSDEYGCRHALLDSIKLSLSGEKSLALEKIVSNSTIDFNKKSELLKKVADLSEDVDKYIEVISDSECVNSFDICNIAERLLDANRPSEAIDWLSHIKDDDYQSKNRDDLLVKAYNLSGDTEKAQQLRWNIFSICCTFKAYENYIQHAPHDQIDEIRTKAIEVAKSYTHLSLSASFLDAIEEYNSLEVLLLKRYIEIDDTAYYVYRPLSTKLAKHGKYLIASLIRRKLIEGLVSKVQSKYYKYAASDYKFCGECSRKVIEWQNFPTHHQFLVDFKEKHKRKKAFWALVE